MSIENIELKCNIDILFGRQTVCQLQLPATNSAYLFEFRGL